MRNDPYGFWDYAMTALPFVAFVVVVFLGFLLVVAAINVVI